MLKSLPIKNLPKGKSPKRTLQNLFCILFAFTVKNAFNSLIVLFLALSYTMAELVPNCSHVLHFSDEEVDCLQKVIQNQREDLYAFYADQADPNILFKYPPHCVNKNIHDTHAIIISNKQCLFSLFFSFF